MKRISLIVTFAIATILCNAQAQVPEKFSFQGILRATDNTLIASQAVAMEISILQGSATGTLVYQETHAVTTNSNGLVSLEIGSGTVAFGDFKLIDWSAGPYFVETKTDPAGGTNYTISAVSQLVSVPFASFSGVSIISDSTRNEKDPAFTGSVAFSITSADTSNWNRELDSAGIASFGYVAGPKTIDTDTQLDSAGVAALGYVAGPKTVDTDDQTLSLSGTTISIVDGNSVNLAGIDTDTKVDSTEVAAMGYVAGPKTVNTDAQTLSFSGSSLSITGGNSVNLSAIDTKVDSSQVAAMGFVAGAITGEIDGSITNEIQVLSINNGVVTLSKNGGNVTLPDASSTNEIQTLSISNDTMYLSGGGFAVLPSNSGGVTVNNTPVNGNLLTFDGTNWVAKNILTGNTGSATAVNNMQPFLTLNFCFCLNGIYPSRNSQNPFIAEIMTFAGNFAPKNWTFCDGQLLSINSYPAAYSLVGTIYGGNGITTFGVPDLRGRTAIHEGQGSGLTNRTLGSRGGSQSNVLSTSNLPAHNHSIVIQ